MDSKVNFQIPMFDFTGHLGKIQDLCITKQNQIIYSVDDHSIRIWDIEKKRLTHVLHSLNQRNAILRLSGAEKYLLAGDPDGYIELWELTNPSRICRIQAFTRKLSSLLFIPHEYIVVATGISDTHLVKKYKFDKNFSLVFDEEIEIDSEAKHLEIGNKNDSVFVVTDEVIINLKFKKMKIQEEIEIDKLSVISVSETREQFASIDNNGLVNLWEIKKFKIIDEFQVDKRDFSNGIMHLKFLSQKGHLIYGDPFKIRIWDIRNNSIISEIKSTKSRGITDEILRINYILSQDILILAGSEKLSLIDYSTGKTLQTIRRSPKNPPFYSNYRIAKLSQDASRLVATRKIIEKQAEKELIEVFDITKNQIFHTLEPDNSSTTITALHIAPDAKFFVTGDDAKQTNGIIWTMKSGKAKKKLKELDYGVNAVIISNDSSQIITADATFDIEVFDSQTGKLLRRLSSTTKHVTSFALTKDNTILACGFRDIMDRSMDIIIWNFQTGEVITQLSAGIEFEDKIVNVEFSFDEKLFYAKSQLGMISSWEVKTWKLKETTRNLETHNFNPIEDQLYAYPFGENIILNLPNQHYPDSILSYLKSWFDKPFFVSLSRDVYLNYQNLSEDQRTNFRSNLGIVDEPAM